MPEFVVVGLVALGSAVVVGVLLKLRSRPPRALDSADGGSPEPGPTVEDAASESEPSSVMGRLADGLARTKGRLVQGVDDLFRGKKEIDEDLWRKLEELLITSDVGVKTAMRLMQEMRERADREELSDPERLRLLLAEQVRALLVGSAGALAEAPEGSPLVIMVVGVNGAGKTTTIGKLAARHEAEGRKVILGAGDTFRAAAIEQIEVWGRRAGAEVVKHEEGSDPAAVAHDAVAAGVARGAQVVICDTAGRLHSKSGLMQELGKVHRVIGNVLDGAPHETLLVLDSTNEDGAPHETLLVLDSTNGQNAIAQAREFSAVVGVTGIVLTKLDGTAKGGVILGIADELDIPVKLIGIGEAVEDLRDFDPESFVDALFSPPEDGGGLGRGSNSAEASAGDVQPESPSAPTADAL